MFQEMTAVRFILSIALFYLGVLHVTGFSTGAPKEVCDDLTPQHNTEAQTKTFPYKIKPSANRIKPSEKVNVTITGNGRETFKGFIIQARVGDTAFGTFQEHPEAKLIDCHRGRKVCL